MAEWRGTHYSDRDLLTMQQEAIRRVQQMQQRARRTVGSIQDVEYAEAPDDPPPRADPPPAPQAAPHAPPAPQGTARTPGASGGQNAGIFGQLAQNLGLGNLGEKLGGLGEKLGLGGGGESSGNLIASIVGEDSPIAKVLDALGIDNERLLLIGLLLILLNEKADKTLLIALVYLLL